jgi:hypothetical protein
MSDVPSTFIPTNAPRIPLGTAPAPEVPYRS